MKKTIFIVILFSILFLNANTIAISIDSGIPLNDFSTNLNKQYGLGIFYIINDNPSFITGLDLHSFKGNNPLYSVNILHFNMGAMQSIYKNNNFLFNIKILSGLSFIEKRISNDYERGFNEFLSFNIQSDYYYRNNIFSLYTGITKEKIIEGKYYIYIGTSFGFNID